MIEGGESMDISILIVPIVVGVLCWLAVTFIPMVEPFPKIVIGVGVVLTVLYLLGQFGVVHL